MSKGRKIFYWIITGIFISLALSSMIFTRDGSLNQFYDDGYVQDLTGDWKNRAYMMGQYDTEEENYKYISGSTRCYVEVGEWQEEMHYLMVDAEMIQNGGATWKIYYRDDKGKDLAVEDVVFQNGKQIIPLKVVENSRIILVLSCVSSTEYKVNSIKVTEYEQLVNEGKMVCGIAVSFFVYSVFSLIVFKCKKRKGVSGNAAICAIEQQTDYILRCLNQPQNTENYARWIRVLLLVAVVFVWRLVNDYGAKIYYGYGVLAHIILFLVLVAWIPKEEQKKCFDSLVLKMWLLLFGVQIVSDILVVKKWGFAGIWLIFSFGLFFCAWSKMKEPEKLLEDFLTAAEILYLINVVYCMVSNYTRDIYGRLNGTWGNPNPFSITVVVYLTVMLFRLYQALLKKGRWHRWLEGILGTGIGIWMLLEAKCRTAWLALIVVIAVFGMAMVSEKILKKKKKREKKKIWLIIVLGMLLLGGLFFLYQRLLPLLGQDTIVISLNDISSGRIDIWSEYLKKMNLLGHDGLAVYAGSAVYAHNGLLKVMYKYGFLTGIIAIIFVVEGTCAVVKMWRERQNKEYLSLVIGLMAAYLIPVSLEAVNEYPMVYFSWFAFYFVIGYVILMQGKKSGMMEYDER